MRRPSPPALPLLLLLVAARGSPGAAAAAALRMAAILDERGGCGRGERLALALARERLNGPGGGRPPARLELEVFELARDSQYETTDTMCQILPKGVVSVLGPAASPAAAATVSHICGEKEIPHIRVGPEEAPRPPLLRLAALSLHPSDEDVSRALGGLLRSLRAPPASLICARPECLLRLEELVRQFLISRESLSVRVLDAEQDPTPLLKEIRDDKVPTIVIDGSAATAALVLAKASELGMTSTFYKYILTTMDFPLLRLDALPAAPATVLGFSMFNTSHRFYPEFVRSLNMSWRESCELGPYPGPALSAALLFDAVHVVVGAVRELNRSQEIGGRPLACAAPGIWPHGTSLMNYLRMVEYDGLTGRVEFNSKGQRTNYSLRVLEKGRDGHREVGVWFSNRTLAMDEATLALNASDSLANKTLIITTILENPYVMRVGGAGGAERYEGFCVDSDHSCVPLTIPTPQIPNPKSQIPNPTDGSQIPYPEFQENPYVMRVGGAGGAERYEGFCVDSDRSHTPLTIPTPQIPLTNPKSRIPCPEFQENPYVMRVGGAERYEGFCVDSDRSHTPLTDPTPKSHIPDPKSRVPDPEFQENPYVMRVGGAGGAERYEGFCVDMLRELAALLKFRFHIKLVEDGLYGAPEPNGSWTGMVGELINRKADLAVAAFTITAEREKVIDFSKPFMTLGISILYRVHMGRKPGYFSFLDPFSPAVWLFMLLAYLAVSCVLFLAARLSPYEWYNPHPCARGRPGLLHNQYTLGNSLWFPVGGFLQQGAEVLPRALSTRCVSGVWWAFTLIIISSYTANLAAFLTVQRMEVPVESADDLADQTNIEYGTIHAGSTMTFFQNSRYQTYQRMWNYMHSKQPSVFVKSTEEGIARVLNSKYAFLLESTMNEYHRRHNCNLTQIGGLLDTKGYGIGMPLGSPFRDEITLAILQLQENNRLEILKRKWWEGGHCPKEEDHRAKGLGMENIGGIFVVLVCGLVVAILVAVMEFVWSTRRSAETEEISLCAEMLRELRRALSCSRRPRPRRRRRPHPKLGHPPPNPLPHRGGREMRFSNGKLYSGLGAGGPPQTELGGASGAPPPPCAHVRVCPECRRIQALRATPPRAPPRGRGRGRGGWGRGGPAPPALPHPPSAAD
ncbi:glutamate receptor ionotropic, kainate 5 [Lonchura striata]